MTLLKRFLQWKKPSANTLCTYNDDLEDTNVLFSKFTGDRGQMITIANRLSIVIMVLVIMLMFSSYHAITNKVVVQLIPPHLDKRVTVAYNKASKEFHLKYGLYAAVLMGNANPETANSIIDALQHVFSPELYKQHKKDLFTQAEMLAKTSSTVQFEPSRWEYEPKTNLVFITGKQTLRPENGRPKIKTMTYEFQLKVVDYVPSIERYALYEGPARNFEYRNNKHALANK